MGYSYDLPVKQGNHKVQVLVVVVRSHLTKNFAEQAAAGEAVAACIPEDILGEFVVAVDLVHIDQDMVPVPDHMGDFLLVARAEHY